MTRALLLVTAALLSLTARADDESDSFWDRPADERRVGDEKSEPTAVDEQGAREEPPSRSARSCVVVGEGKAEYETGHARDTYVENRCDDDVTVAFCYLNEVGKKKGRCASGHGTVHLKPKQRYFNQYTFPPGVQLRTSACFGAYTVKSWDREGRARCKGDAPGVERCPKLKTAIRAKGAYAAAYRKDAEELAHHLELLRTQRGACVDELVGFVREELEHTTGGCCGFSEEQRFGRTSFLLDLLGELDDRRAELFRERPGPSTAKAPDEAARRMDLSVLRELEEDQVLGTLMRRLIEVAPAACTVGSIPASASCGFDLGTQLQQDVKLLPRVDAASGVRALEKHACQLRVFPLRKKYPGGDRGRFWKAVWDTYCR